MLEMLVSLLGGAGFRMIWGEVSGWFNKRQDHSYELERMRLQAEMDNGAHTRQLEMVRLQADLGVKAIEIKADADMMAKEADAYIAAIRANEAKSGIKWVDAWNKAIRPAFATVALFLWCAALARAGFVMQEWDVTMIGSITGFFFASRVYDKRGS